MNRKTLLWIIFSVALAILIILGVRYLFRSAMNDLAEGFAPGTGLGSVGDTVDKYQGRYLQQYADTFLLKFPAYTWSSEDVINDGNTKPEAFETTGFYFRNYPREIYWVQWEGTGFISVRTAFDCEKGKAIIENTLHGSFIPDSTKTRITIRLRHEILDKIDSIIAHSPDSVKALLHHM